MLVLTRKLGEGITIGDDIKVTVLGIYGHNVRLGIEAPLKVVVHREEIFVKVQKENTKPKKGNQEGILGLVNTLRDKFKNP